jgi:hypothetical protein
LPFDASVILLFHLQPLEEVFATNLALAIKNSNAPQDAGEQGGFSMSQNMSVESCLKQVS